MLLGGLGVLNWRWRTLSHCLGPKMAEHFVSLCDMGLSYNVLPSVFDFFWVPFRDTMTA